jgi:hypothetical protein
MATDANRASDNRPLARVRANKATRRKREIALLLASLGLAIGAFIFHEPFLILISIFPALASYSQR